MKLGNFYEAINDTSKALQFLDPPVEANAMMRVKAYMRRGRNIFDCELFLIFVNDRVTTLNKTKD